MKLSIKKIIGILVTIFAVGFIAGFIIYSNLPTNSALGANFPDAVWQTVSAFSGYETELDPEKIPQGGTPQGQNTTVFEGDRIGVRDLGYTVFPEGTASTSGDKITSLHTFRKRSGENIMMRSYSTFLEYFDETGDVWEVLKSGYTSEQKFGFADININTDQVSYVYFGNAVESFSRWNGSHTNLTTTSTSTATTLFVSDTTGFDVTGSIIYCGTEIAYTAKTATTFVVGSAHACTSGRAVAQVVEETAGNPKGNIYLAADNRLFISGQASSTQQIFFSKYADATTFVNTLVTESTADSAGIFNLVEGGGGVVGMVLDADSLYFFKRSIIYKATLSDSLYTIVPLKTFDGKSQTVGATNDFSTFTGGNSVFFITPDNQIFSLGSIELINTPQITSISEVIQPTINDINPDASAGIVFRDKAYFSTKSDTTIGFNDVIFIFNLKTKQWDTPVLGFNASDFIVYDDGTSEELYFGSSNSTNIYKVNSTPVDDVYSVTASYRTKEFDFKMPHLMKEVTDFYVDGYISPNTTLTISLLLDNDGFTETYTTEFKGTEDDYIFNAGEFNLFGLSPFGTKRFGSNDDLSGKQRFRVYLNESFRPKNFYTAQLEFASDGPNQSWEIMNYSFKIREATNPQRRSLFRKFN